MSRKSKADAVVVSRKELSDALQALRPIVKKAGNAILKSVLMRADSCPDAPCLTISATNMETTLSLEIAREDGAEDFAALVDLDRLAAFVAADWAETVSLSLAKGRLEAEGRTTVRMVIEPIENYPELPKPPGGAGIMLPHAVIEEIGYAKGFVNTDEKRRGGWERVLHVFTGVTLVDVLAGNGHRAWWRRGLGEEAPADFAIGLTPETVSHLVAQAGKGAVCVRSGGRQDFFSGPGFLLAQTRPVHDPPPLEWLNEAACQPEEWSELPQLGNILPVVEAVTLEAGERSPVIFTGNGGETLVSVKSDMVEAEGMIAGELPVYKTGYPDDLLSVLKALDRVSGTDHKIEVGRFGHGHLRFRIEGLAEALVSGMQ